MVITLLEQTMWVGYPCMRKYILSMNILINIQYNQISLSDGNQYIYIYTLADPGSQML